MSDETSPFTKASPCPICGGHDRQARGRGERCGGFLSSDGKFAHCTRDELAGRLTAERGGTFAHRLTGRCRCGETHGAASPERARIVATYPYTDETGAPLFEVVRFEPKRFLQRRPDGQWGIKGVRRVLYHLPEVIAAVGAGDRIYIAEGEKDVESLRAVDCVATCNPQGAGKWRDDYAEFLTSADVVIIEDQDDPGRAHARDVAVSLEGVAKSVVIVRPATGKDAADHLAAGFTVDEFVRAGVGAEPPLASRNRLIVFSTVEHRPIRWYWRGRIPLGKITVIDGDPGLAKTTLTLDIAARTTSGRLMPDGSPGIEGNVVFLSAEDDVADTIAPRFTAAGGDPSRCALLDGLASCDGDMRPPELPTDVLEIEEIVRDFDAKLVVIDPLMAFLADDVSSGNDHKVRRALAPLKSMAERTGAAVVLVRHLNKDKKNGSAVYRGGGSIGIIGAARSGLMVARDPEDPDRRVLAVTKANLAPPNATGSLGFRVVPAPNGVGVIEWLGESRHSADDLVRPLDVEDGALGGAVEFLRSQLAEGPVLAKDLTAGAKVAGISESTLKRARAALGVEASKGFDGAWRASLPARST